jgi:hypothetical protein
MEDSFIQVAKCLACQRPIPKFNLVDSTGASKRWDGSHHGTGSIRRGITGFGTQNGLPVVRPPSGRFMADGAGNGEGLNYDDFRWRNVRTPDDQDLALHGELDGVRHIGAAFPKRKFNGSIPHTNRGAPKWKQEQMEMPTAGEFPGHMAMSGQRASMNKGAVSLPSLRGGGRGRGIQ